MRDNNKNDEESTKETSNVQPNEGFGSSPNDDNDDDDNKTLAEVAADVRAQALVTGQSRKGVPKRFVINLFF
jgi:predicted nucleic acid-binding protein